MSPRRAAVMLLLCGAILLAGCWDVREMNQLALVMAVGIDKADTPGRLEVTIQVARPGAAGNRGGAMNGGGGGDSVFTATADGDTIFAAIRNLAQFTSRRIMWAHNNVVVIGESLAREDVTPVIDFFTRNPELRLRTWIVVARETSAKSIVSAKTGMEQIPANSISALFRYAALPGESVRADVSEAMTEFLSPDRNMVIPAMVLTERAVPPTDQPGEHGGSLQAELRGSALFRKQRLVGFVDKDEGRGLLWLRGVIRNAAVTIPCDADPSKNIAVEIRGPRVKVQSDISRRVPSFHVDVETWGWLNERDCPAPTADGAAVVDYANRALTRKIEGQIRGALQTLQEELSVDAVDFGRRLHVQHPDWWRQNRHRWPALFPEVKTSVSIRVHIQKLGLFARPMTGAR